MVNIGGTQAVDLTDRFSRDMGFTRNRYELASLVGAAYSGGIRDNAPVAAGNGVILRLTNIAASGKTVNVVQLEIGANVTRVGSIFYATPAAADLVNAVTIVNHQAGGPAAVAHLTNANNNPVPVANPAWRLRTPAGDMRTFPFFYSLPQNSTLDVTFNDAGNAVTDLFLANLSWYEI